MESRIGQRLGSYRLIELLGVGGFAEVYLGEHIYLNTQRAIKVLRAFLEDNAKEGFLHEAQIVSGLNHPQIVCVHDFEVEDHTPFLVMDYFPQGNMRRLYPKGTQLPLPVVVSYMQQLASGLQYAHDQKIIHRDVKPENMLLDPHNNIVISDFGVALLSQSSRYHNTQEIAGTAAYMAPEQFQGHPQRASDQYSSGIVAYEWLVGDLPFHGTFTEIASQHLFVPPPPFSEKVSMLPLEVEQVVRKALEKDPQKRFEDMKAFAAALEQASQAIPSTFSVSANGFAPVSRPTTDTAQTAPAIATFTSGVGAIDKIIVEDQALVPANNAPTSPSSLNRVQKAGPSLSRRTVIASLGGVAGLGMGAIALRWLASTRIGTQTAHAKNGAPAGIPHTPSTIKVPHTPSTIKEGTVLLTYPSTNNVDVVAWSPNGKYIASSGDDPTIYVWDASTGKTVFTYTGHSAAGPSSLSVVDLAWSPDSSRIVSASAIYNPNSPNGPIPDIQVWEVATQKLITTYTGHNPPSGSSNVVGSVAWSPDSTRIVSAGVYDGTTQIWDAKTGKTIFTYRGQYPSSVLKARWSPDGQYIASASNGSVIDGRFSPDNPAGAIHVWHTSGQKIFTYPAFPYIGDLAWSFDSQFIASTNSEQTVQIWEALTGNVKTTVTGSSPIAYSYDGKYVAVTEISSPNSPNGPNSLNSSIELFDISTGKISHTFNEEPAQVFMIAWSPDGKRIAYCMGIGINAVKVWQA